MSLELLNLVKAKRVAGDVDWLAGECEKHLAASAEPVRIAALHYLTINTGFASFNSYRLCTCVKDRIYFYSFILAILIRKDYDKLSLPANQSEAEHAEMLAKLTEIVNHPDLAAKIQITITTK